MRFFLLCIGELHPDFVSRNIQAYLTDKYGTTVDWSHCAIEVEGETVRPDEQVWDSTGRGFEPGLLLDALDHGEAVVRHRIQLHVNNEAMAMGWLRGNRGRGYSNLQYVLFLPCPGWLRKLLHAVLPGPILHLFKNGRRRAVCSETIGYFIRDNHPVAGLNDQRLREEAIDRLDPFLAYKVADAWQYFESGSAG